MRRAAIYGQIFRAGAIWGAKLGAFVTLAALGLSGCADIAVLHTPATMVGLATTPKEPKDFVKETHPDTTSFTSVGVEPGHPAEKPRDPAGVKQLQAELEAQRTTGHAILQTLSPPAPPTEAVQTREQKAKARLAAKRKQQEDAAKQKKEAPGEAQGPL